MPSPDRSDRVLRAIEVTAHHPIDAPDRDLLIAELQPDSGLSWDDKATIAISATRALVARVGELEAKLTRLAVLGRYVQLVERTVDRHPYALEAGICELIEATIA